MLILTHGVLPNADGAHGALRHRERLRHSRVGRWAHLKKILQGTRQTDFNKLHKTFKRIRSSYLRIAVDWVGVRVGLVASRHTVALDISHHPVARRQHRRRERLLQLLLLLPVFRSSVLKLERDVTTIKTQIYLHWNRSNSPKPGIKQAEGEFVEKLWWNWWNLRNLSLKIEKLMNSNFNS